MSAGGVHFLGQCYAKSAFPFFAFLPANKARGLRKERRKFRRSIGRKESMKKLAVYAGK